MLQLYQLAGSQQEEQKMRVRTLRMRGQHLKRDAGHARDVLRVQRSPVRTLQELLPETSI